MISIAAAVTASDSKLNQFGNGFMIWLGRHWLFLFNAAWGVYLFTPFLAPIFMQLGWVAPANALYSIYSVLCHQLPDHSYFLFGPTLVPQDSLLIAGGMTSSDSLVATAYIFG